MQASEKPAQEPTRRTMEQSTWAWAAAASCVVLIASAGPANSQQLTPELFRPAVCDELHVDGRSSAPLQTVTLPPPRGCTTRTSNGFPVPDPNCTPGAVDPTVTIAVLRDRSFTTRCVRDVATNPAEKAATYTWYNLAFPSNNSGQSQICELDHLISLELGGADTLDNVWPQCGPSGVALPQRFFKEKDVVENFLAMQVRQGRMELGAAQRGIAADWTQFLGEARRVCPEGRCF
jgi:hypothetical protein